MLETAAAAAVGRNYRDNPLEAAARLRFQLTLATCWNGPHIDGWRSSSKVNFQLNCREIRYSELDERAGVLKCCQLYKNLNNSANSHGGRGAVTRSFTCVKVYLFEGIFCI